MALIILTYLSFEFLFKLESKSSPTEIIIFFTIHYSSIIQSIIQYCSTFLLVCTQHCFHFSIIKFSNIFPINFFLSKENSLEWFSINISPDGFYRIQIGMVRWQTKWNMVFAWIISSTINVFSQLHDFTFPATEILST